MGRPKGYVVRLVEADRERLRTIVARRNSPQGEVLRSRIVLTCEAHPDWTDREVAASIPIRPTVETYPLEEANRALQELKRGKIQGAKVLEYSVHGKIPDKINAPAGSYRASDGWLALTLVRETCWHRICTALEREDLRDDPRFATFDDRARNVEELTRIIDEVIATRTAGEWVDRLLENADVPVRFKRKNL